MEVGFALADVGVGWVVEVGLRFVSGSELYDAAVSISVGNCALE